MSDAERLAIEAAAQLVRQEAAKWRGGVGPNTSKPEYEKLFARMAVRWEAAAKALEGAPTPPSYTREEILALLAVAPCHVTGMHDPEHHLESPHHCSFQLVKALDHLLTSIGATRSDLPRRLHGPDCGWCHRIPAWERDRKELRRTYEWAGVPIPKELAECGL